LRYVLVAMDKDSRELMRLISMHSSQTEHVINACQDILSVPVGSLEMAAVPKQYETFGVKLDEDLACQVDALSRSYKVAARVFYYNALILYIKKCLKENEYQERLEYLLKLIQARTKSNDAKVMSKRAYKEGP
jgi:hypothetical protein